jgi:transposase
MPEASLLRRYCTGGETVVSFGRRLVFEYADGDLGMRNLAIAALRDAGVSGLEIAEVFDLSPEQVSRLRARVRRLGSAGLAPLRGRPPKLSKRDVATVRRLAAEGISKTEIAKRFGVARSVIGETLKKFGSAPVQEPLGLSAPDKDDSPVAKDAPDDGAPDADDAPDDSAPAESAPFKSEQTESGPCNGVSAAGLARIATGEHPSRYAGASLLYPYLDMVGAADVFSTLSGGRARRYDDLSVLATAVTGFALGIDTVEGSKHLRRFDAGALVGVREIPELRTFRERLSALADGSDPLALQRAFAKATLLADPPASPVYYVDDHFVAYAGGRPVAKGWNTKRRCAGPGRDDTHVCDERGRAVVFASSERSGLSATMPSVLSQLREVVGPDAPILLGFDRGGSYPKAFRACREANMGWITYRRGKLAEVKGRIKRSWVVRGERRVVVTVADEVINIAGYGRARQLTLFERGQAVLQVLTSDMTASGAALLLWLRGRWSIENLFKYASSHNGIDSIASYLMDVGPDDRLVANPLRKAARARVAAAEATLATAERALAQSLCDPGRSVEETNAQIAGLHHAVDLATVALTSAQGALVGIPAKVPATELDPGAKRAKMRLERRGLQMVCRLLAFNAEAWLAEHFNVYLGDPDENRAIMRHLLHLGGSFSYQHSTIIVTLDRPDSPRVARALELLTEELNAHSARLLGDCRPLCYRVMAAA